VDEVYVDHICAVDRDEGLYGQLFCKTIPKHGYYEEGVSNVLFFYLCYGGFYHRPYI
jgi:hypothetical protein